MGIDAPPERIWALLTDAPRHALWNSTVSRLEGEIALGGTVRMQVPSAPGRTFSPKVVAFDAPRHMVWADGFFPMFRGTRTFSLTPEGGGTVFEMVELFEGLMLPFIRGSLPDFVPIFDRYAADLKAAAEAG